MRFAVSAAAWLATALLTASCGVSSSGSGAAASPPTGPASSSAGSSAPLVPSSAQAPASSAAATAPCPTGSLRIAEAPGSGGAAGSFYFDLTFTNTRSSSCTLSGYPGISFVTAGHAQIGRPAARQRVRARLVTLRPGRVASVQLQVPDTGDYPVSACHAATAAFIKVYPPGQTAAAYVPAGTKVCTTSSGQTAVWTIVPGKQAGY